MHVGDAADGSETVWILVNPHSSFNEGKWNDVQDSGMRLMHKVMWQTSNDTAWV